MLCRSCYPHIIKVVILFTMTVLDRCYTPWWRICVIAVLVCVTEYCYFYRFSLTPVFRTWPTISTRRRPQVTPICRVAALLEQRSRAITVKAPRQLILSAFCNLLKYWKYMSCMFSFQFQCTVSKWNDTKTPLSCFEYLFLWFIFTNRKYAFFCVCLATVSPDISQNPLDIQRTIYRNT